MVFTHFPKTAGTSLAAGLQRSLSPRRAVGGFDLSVFGGVRDFSGIAPALMRLVHQTPAQLPGDADFISGHFAASTTFSAYPDSQHITLLREPFSRLLSHYFYWRSLSDADLAAWSQWGHCLAAARSPLAEFLRDERVACQTDNVYVRLLLWPHPLIPNAGWIDPVHDQVLVENALRRLGSYAHVDVLENPAMLPLLERWLGCRLAYPRLNPTPPMPPQRGCRLEGELGQTTVELLAARTRLDLRLWNAVIQQREMGNASLLQLRALIPAVARYTALSRGG